MKTTYFYTAEINDVIGDDSYPVNGTFTVENEEMHDPDFTDNLINKISDMHGCSTDRIIVSKITKL